jgi:hypothetical protein
MNRGLDFSRLFMQVDRGEAIRDEEQKDKSPGTKYWQAHLLICQAIWRQRARINSCGASISTIVCIRVKFLTQKKAFDSSS